jgi:hypothetical protein
MAEPKLRRRQFSPHIMNRNWDLSNEVYVDLIEEQRKLESELHPDKIWRSRLFSILVGIKEDRSKN